MLMRTSVSQRRGVSRLCFDSIMFCCAGSESSLWDQSSTTSMVSSHHWFLYQSSDFSAGFRGTSLPKSSRCLKSPGVRIIRVPTRKRRTGYLFLTGENRSYSWEVCLAGSVSCASDWSKDRNHLSSQHCAVIVSSLSSPNLIRTFHFDKQLYGGKLRNILQLLKWK